jgi:hypothetical protein
VGAANPAAARVTKVAAVNQAASRVVKVAAKMPAVAAVRRAAAVNVGAAIANLHCNLQGESKRLALYLSILTVHTKQRDENIMDAFELLTADHEKVAGILESIEETTERALKGREELFARLKSEMDLHALIEEEIFYPALEEADETRDVTLEAYEEHRLVKQLLSELEAEEKDTEEWTAKFTVLKENIEHHVEEEEDEMFKQARKVLSEEQIEMLGDQLQEAKQGNRRAVA